MVLITISFVLLVLGMLSALGSAIFGMAANHAINDKQISFWEAIFAAPACYAVHKVLLWISISLLVLSVVFCFAHFIFT